MSDENKYEALKVSIFDRHHGDVSRTIHVPGNIVEFFRGESWDEHLATLFKTLHYGLEANNLFPGYNNLHLALNGVPAISEYEEASKGQSERSYLQEYPSQGELNYNFTNRANPISFLDVCVNTISESNVSQFYTFDNTLTISIADAIEGRHGIWQYGFISGCKQLDKAELRENLSHGIDEISEKALDLGIIASLYRQQDRYRQLIPSAKISIAPVKDDE